MLVMEVMKRIPVKVSENQFVADVLPDICRCREALYPVTDLAGRLLGTISPTDILEVVANNTQSQTMVRSLINPDVQTVSPEAMIYDVSYWAKGEIYVVDEQGILKGRIFSHQVCQLLRSTLQNNRVELKTVLQSVHNGILAVDKSGRVTIFNAAAERLLGISAQAVLGKHLLDLLPGSAGLLEIMETGQAELGKTHRVGDNVYLINRSPVLKNGEVIGAVSVFQDLTELESIHAQLNTVKELNKELEGIIQSSYDAIVVTDGEGKLLKISSGYSRITGFPCEEINRQIGQNMREVVKQGLVSKSVSLMVLEQKQPVTIEQKVRTGKDILITGNPIFDDSGKIVRVVTNIRDLTEINALKEEVKYTRKLNAIYSTELAELRAKHMVLPDMEVRSQKMKRVLECAHRVAQVNSTVLITGETGVGKEMIAKYIHQASSRKDQPFIQINCGAIPENLLESELFGYEKGAFTGADRSGKVGLLEVANHGTLLLDEIGEMPQSLQVKLLRVLQERRIQRIGGVKPIKLDVRILAATNKNLEEMVLQGTFREDLYYRLNVVPIHPGLRTLDK